MTLHVGRPNVGDRTSLLNRINRILDDRWFTNNGPLVAEFEERLARYLGVKHCLVINNATIALEIAARALNLSGEVIVPSYTFIATAHALFWQGITPVFADIDPDTHTIDPQSVERLINSKTTGIVGVHLWGRVCDTVTLRSIADRHGLALMYDAAHAFGCTRDGVSAGNFGRCEVFSFHATKFLNSFEGGALATNDDDLAERVRLLRNFGFRGFDDVAAEGTNGKMPEVCAAMGLTSLEAIDQILRTNKQNYHQYRTELESVPGVSLFVYPEHERNNFQYIVVEIDPAASGITRDELIQRLHDDDILARRYFWPGCHRAAPYRDDPRFAPLPLPNTEIVANRVIVLPTGQQVSPGDIYRVCALISDAVASARKLGK